MSFRARWARFRSRYPLARLLERLRSPEGRADLGRSFTWLYWPLLAPAAALGRRTWLRDVRVVAVTGSLGKSTTTRAIAAVLGLPDDAHRRRNFGAALATSLLRARRDRPLVVEVGISAPGQMRGYGRMLAPDVVVVTSLAREHVRALGDLDGVAREKGELVAALRPGGLAILPGDDPRAGLLADRCRTGRILRFGLGAGNDLRAESIRLEWPPATGFELVGAFGRRAVRLRLVGEPMVRAAVAALAAAGELGVDPDAAVASLERLAPTPGRLEPRPLASGAWVLADEFKGGVDTIERALEALAAIPARRRLVVHGDVEEAPQGHAFYRELGRRVGAVADRVVALGYHMDSFASGVRSAGLAPEAIVKCRTFEEVPAALGPLGPGDLVLVKGRSDQKLERAVRRLEGLPVVCPLKRCFVLGVRCTDCPALLRAR